MSFYKPKDFEGWGADPGLRAKCANRANRLLEERGVRVLGCAADGDKPEFWLSTVKAGYMPTHQALLVCIEELPKKECEHKDIMAHASLKFYDALERVTCGSCGVRLKATWSAE